MEYARHIYCYRFAGSPVYVGSAWDVEKRDGQHRRETLIPFERWLEKEDPKNVTLEIVETVTADTLTGALQRTADRENYWMHVLATFRRGGCFNSAPAVTHFDTEEQYANWRAAMRQGCTARNASPEYQANLKAAQNRLQEKTCSECFGTFSGKPRQVYCAECAPKVAALLRKLRQARYDAAPERKARKRSGRARPTVPCKRPSCSGLVVGATLRGRVYCTDLCRKMHKAEGYPTRLATAGQVRTVGNQDHQAQAAQGPEATL